jgi:hypothetical protein
MKDDLINRFKNDVMQEQINKDGVNQIGLGAFLLLASMFLMFDNLFLAWLSAVIIPLLSKQLRKKFTYPRIGYVKLQINDRFGITWSQFILTVLIVGILAYFLLTNTEVYPRNSSKLFIPVFLTISLVSLIVGTKTNISKGGKQNLVYVLTFIVPGIALFVFNAPETTFLKILLGLGLLNLIYGIIVLKAFIKKYPVLKDEE